MIIAKSEELLLKAKEIFGDEIVNITMEGQRHIGAVLGTEDFKKKYVTNKVRKWVQDVVDLSSIAKEEPQAAL